MLTRANQGMVINKKSSYCKDLANQERVNQGPTVFGDLFQICCFNLKNHKKHL